MKIARRSRARAEFLEAVRSELARTRDELRAGVAAVETGLYDVSERLDDGLRTLLDELDCRETAMLTRQTEVLVAIERRGEAWRDLYTSGLKQHQAVLDAVERLNTTLTELPSRPSSDGAIVVGGTIDPGGLAAHPSGAARAELLLHGVEVRCRFSDNRWVNGFEVCDVFDQDGALQYRLRRQSDGYVLPTLFDDSSVRQASSFPSPKR